MADWPVPSTIVTLHPNPEVKCPARWRYFQDTLHTPLSEGFLPLVLLLCQLALAQPSADQLAQAWAEQFPVLKAQGFRPVTLQPADFTQLAKGEVAKRRLPADGVDRALGAIWSPLDRRAVWISILDDSDFTLVDSLTEIRLSDSANGHKRLYQHLDLPWPVADRHWVLQIKNNPALDTVSGGVIWERVWDLTEESDVPDGRPEAIWSPVNDGGWILMKACGGTLVVYHARSYIGGHIPKEAVTRWAMTTLNGLLKKTVERAAGIHTHYISGHVPIHGPDGSKLPVW